MKTFNQFIFESVATTRRQGMQHFQKMDPIEFVEWLRDVKRETQGVLKNIKAVMKVDGLGARFGKDKNGKPFLKEVEQGLYSIVVPLLHMQDRTLMILLH